MAVQGVGSLIAADVLSDVSLALVEPLVATAVPGGGIAPGLQTVTAWDPSIYAGAMLVVGANTANIEVVVVTAIAPGVSFTAQFAESHAAGDSITGPTFPVQQAAGDPFFTQSEMLGYLSTALNDFLVKVPLAYAVTTAVTFKPSAGTAALPADCQTPARVAVAGVALRESSQTNLDSMNPYWSQAAAATPYVYYRDKIGVLMLGIWPRSNNTVPTELLYAQRSPETIGMADEFLIPDVFLPTIKARVLSFAYSKDGEQASPAMARFYGQRFEYGCKIASILLDVIEDASAQ